MSPQESAIYPDVGLPANRTRVRMAMSSRQVQMSGKALMWKISTRGFTLQEVLIMAATNIVSALIATDKTERTTGTAPTTEIQQTPGEMSWQR